MLVSLVLAALAGELALRAFGLGNPPLSVPHPTIEYMFAPGQDIRRFRNRVLINEWGMRSASVNPTKPAGEHRILALGDSVLNGGSLTDHADLATTVLSTGNRLVLNASAGSWGPPNLLAYVREFGLFDADVVALVLNSEDAFDTPTFAPLNPNTHPTRRPRSAIGELVSRYVLGRLRAKAAIRRSGPVSTAGEVGQLVDIAKAGGAFVCIVHHATIAERSGSFLPGQREIEAVAVQRGVPLIESSNYIDVETGFSDNVHLSREGQRGLARAILACRPGGRAGPMAPPSAFPR